MMDTPTIRALVVDDSALYRKFVASVLEEIPNIEVIGTASNGEIGLAKIESLQPDFITLDLEMPIMDGLGLLRKIKDRKLQLAVIMISSLTAKGAKATNTALQLGAFDFVLKPVGKGPNESRQQLAAELSPKIKAYVEQMRNRSLLRPAKPVAIQRVSSTVLSKKLKPKIVCIGVSTGGPVALSKMLPQLPADLRCPVVLVQHMPPLFTKTLADDLNRICPLEVVEAANGMELKPGKVFIAPGGAQMRVGVINGKNIAQITDDPPERSCKPAVDYLFRSVANQFGGRAVATILTGMGDDGTLGCQLLKRKGATILAQDEASCVVYGMPKSVTEAGVVDQTLPLGQMADGIIKAIR